MEFIAMFVFADLDLDPDGSTGLECLGKNMNNTLKWNPFYSTT